MRDGFRMENEDFANGRIDRNVITPFTGTFTMFHGALRDSLTVNDMRVT